MDRSDHIADLIDASPAADALSVLGPTVRILAEHGTANDDPSLICGEMGSGVLVPLHSHEDAENWYVVRGTVQVYRDGDGWTEFDAGASFRVMSGVRHALHNRSDAPVVMLLVTTVRMARFFHAIGTPAAAAPAGPPSPEALARLVEAARRFGYWLGAPDDNAAIGLQMG